jgi:small subunit ribosomal protein S1
MISSHRSNKDEVITVIPTEANLGWLLVDMHGIKWFVPLSQLAPIHYPRVEDGDQEAIFGKVASYWSRIESKSNQYRRRWKENYLIRKRSISEKKEKRWLAELAVGKTFDGVVSGLSSYGLFVTIGGTVEWLGPHLRINIRSRKRYQQT